MEKLPPRDAWHMVCVLFPRHARPQQSAMPSSRTEEPLETVLTERAAAIAGRGSTQRWRGVRD